MKKIIIIMTIILSISIYLIFDDTDTNAIEKNNEGKKVTKEKSIKEDYKYITINNDNIDELLKENVKEVVETKYVYVENDRTIEEKIPESEIKTGEVEENGDFYYYDENGIMQKNIFVEKKYYDEEGKKVFGFKEIENNLYYFNEDGYVTGNIEIEGNIYYFNEDGIMQKDIVIENCYYDQEGKLYTGFKEIDSNTYYFNKEGYLKGINEIDNKKYIFDDEGHLIKNSFYDKYYLDKNGEVVTGKKVIGDRTYIFDENGILLNGFKVIDGDTYFLDENNQKLKGLQLIDNIRYYFDFETGALIKKDVKSVIDISSWQGDIDFEKLKESKLVDGVIVRVGYGTTDTDKPVLDSKFERNIKELKRLNIPYGIYLFGYAQNEDAATIEAEFVTDIIKKYDLNLSYPIFYDAELTEFNGVKYTKILYKKVINKFISVLNNNGYNEVGVYGNLYMLTKGNLNTLQKRIPKWVAQYNTVCQYDKDYIGWQYASDGIVPGIKEKVDMNIFY